MAKRGPVKVPFTLHLSWIFVHLKHAENCQALPESVKGVVLRGDNVKDDNGHRAEFAKQGASASQVAAAENSWVHVTSSGIAEMTRTRLPTTVDKTTTQAKTENIGIYFKNQRFHLKEIFWATCWRGLLWEEGGWEEVLLKQHREKTVFGMSICPPKSTPLLVRMCGRHQDGWKARPCGTDVENWKKKHRSGRTDPFLNHIDMGCTQRRRSGS